MFDALKKSMIDAIEEGQLKLGYRDETIRLYYPLESLCALTGKKLDAAQMMRELEAFFTKDEAELGKIEISRRGDRFCLAVGPKGAAWVHAHTNPNGFLAAFIAAIGRHGCTMDELLAVFNRYGDRVHVEELHNGEFDWLISFEDGQPDAYRYCIADEAPPDLSSVYEGRLRGVWVLNARKEEEGMRRSKRGIALGAALCVLTLVVSVLLQKTGYLIYLNSDMASEIILANRQAQTHSLVQMDWLYSDRDPQRSHEPVLRAGVCFYAEL